MKFRQKEMGRFVADTMVATGHVQRVLRTETDPLTGWASPVYADVYEGPCLVYAIDSAKDVHVTSGSWTVSKYAVILPAGTDVKIGDVVTPTSSPFAPELEGVIMRIIDTPLNAWQVALACTAERVQP